MANKPRYKEAAVLAAIRGSRGIITVIAQKLGCKWDTAAGYINGKFSTKRIKSEYAAEGELIVDLAESILLTKLNAIRKKQMQQLEELDRWEKNRVGNPDLVKPKGDVIAIPDDLARWLLSRKGKDRGYADRQEITGADGKPLESHIVFLPTKKKIDEQVLNDGCDSGKTAGPPVGIS